MLKTLKQATGPLFWAGCTVTAMAIYQRKQLEKQLTPGYIRLRHEREFWGPNGIGQKLLEQLQQAEASTKNHTAVPNANAVSQDTPRP